MDPVPVGNTTPLSQEASGVDIVSAGSVPTDEVNMYTSEFLLKYK